jgi:hypothetical protein
MLDRPELEPQRLQIERLKSAPRSFRRLRPNSPLIDDEDEYEYDKALPPRRRVPYQGRSGSFGLLPP